MAPKRTTVSNSATFLQFTTGSSLPAANHEITKELLASLIFSFLAALVAIYILFVMVRYGCKHKLFSCEGKRQEIGFSSVINNLTMFSAFFVIIYVASELPLVVPQRPPFCAPYLTKQHSQGSKIFKLSLSNITPCFASCSLYYISVVSFDGDDV
ncbi:unnamed protein product [Clavelina lepadiformis]|uniref:Uncharacterized protein n=1 Tax=Clavelina lepadiformis TaxID=159417 RepID=A0ABP0FT22_CLALP